MARGAAQEAAVKEPVEAWPGGDQVGLAEPKSGHQDPPAADAAFDHQGKSHGILHQLDHRRAVGQFQPDRSPRTHTLQRPMSQFDEGRRPPLVQLVQVFGFQLDGLAADRRQVGLEETAGQRVQGVGAADQQLPTPMQPVQQGILLGASQDVGIQVVPNHVGDAGRRQQAGREGHVAVDLGQQDVVIDRPG